MHRQALTSRMASGETDGPTLVHCMIERAGLRDPSGAALRHGDRELCHGDLSRRARQLACHLLDRGIAPGSVVAVRLDRSFDQIIACLAILHAGSAFMAIDPTDPVERADSLIAAGAAAAIITDAARAGDHRGTVIVIDGEPGKAIDAAPAITLPTVSGTDLAYVIHTSGSTGVPNGVEITHASLLNLIDWTNAAFDITWRDRTSHAHGLGFDAVIWELWPALAAGATIHIIDDVVRTSPPLLRAALLDQRITIAFVPTVLAEPLIAADWPSDAPLRLLLTGGDVLRAYPRKPLPFALVNNYGPAECTVQTTWGIVPMRAGDQPDGDLPTIGRPIDGVLVHILDDRQQPVADGIEGEIWIGGKSVGRGYRNRPELTARKFWPDPFSSEPGARMYRTGDRACRLGNGEIAFRGRADRQVKIDGIRIELDEIAVALQRHPGVGSALVRALDLPGQGKVLTAYVVAAPIAGGGPTPLDLRQFLYRCLPRNYIPRFFVMLAAMPLTRNGKVDLAALPLPEPSHHRADPGADRPLSDLERRIVAIVGDVLNLDRIALDDNFFLLGGHSLVATAAIVRCRDAFGVPVSLRDLFEAETIGDFAAAVHDRLVAKVSTMADHEVEAMLAARPGC